MGALAHTDRGAPGWLREMEPSRPERTPARRGRPVERRRASRASWNVLAQELVAFPPPAGPAVRRPAQRPAHRPGLVRAVPAVPQGSAPARVAGCEAARVHDEVTSRRAVARAAEATPPAVGTLDHATSARSRQVAPRSRGLRRLLPGAATLAVLASVWFGTGALSSLHRPALTVPAAAVKVHGGYLYIAAPRRHAVVDRLRAPARRRPEAARRRARAAAARCPAGRG